MNTPPNSGNPANRRVNHHEQIIHLHVDDSRNNATYKRTHPNTVFDLPARGRVTQTLFIGITQFTIKQPPLYLQLILKVLTHHLHQHHLFQILNKIKTLSTGKMLEILVNLNQMTHSKILFFMR